MKPLNIAVYSVFGIISVALLLVWYYTELNHVDPMLDLALSFIWWVVAGISIYVIMQVEKRRKERIRTVYVNGNELFNPEVGTIKLEGSTQVDEAAFNIVNGLRYDFSRKEFPEEETFKTKYLIRTLKVKGGTWEGEVVNVKTRKVMEFRDREELAEAIKTEGN